MSIATEIQRLQNAKANIKTAIENKGVTVGDGTIDTYAEKIGEISGGGGDYNQGYEDGKNSVYSADKFFRNCKQVKIYSLNDLYDIYGSSSVVINLDKANTLEWFCSVTISEVSNINTTVEHLTINCPNQVSNIRELLYCGYNVADKTLKRLTLNVDTSKATNFWGMFAYQQALEVVDGYPIDCSSAIGGISMFNNTKALKDIRFVANTIKGSFDIAQCPNLSNETIQSIIDGLADLTGGTAQTLTLHADVGAKLTDEQKATITAKNWTLVY